LVDERNIDIDLQRAAEHAVQNEPMKKAI
jgi:hypothetical protein